MGEQFQKMLLLIVIILLVILTAVVVFQQKTITAIKNQIAPVPEQSLEKNGQPSPKNQPQADLVLEAVKGNIAENSKNITGKVTQVSDQGFSVEIEVYDLEKAEVESSEGGGYAISPGTPKKMKKCAVTITEQTKLGKVKKSEIKPGNILLIQAEESVYKADTLTALEIKLVK